jgi:hypothetical protein
MPPEATVLCAHCGFYLPRKREREHRRLAAQPYVLPPPALPSRLRRVGVNAHEDDDDLDPVNVVSNGEALGGTYDGIDVWHTNNPQVENDVENPQSDGCLVPGAFRNACRSRWGGNMTDVRDDSSDGDLDEEEPSHLPLEDDEHEREPGYVDWAAIEANSGLSAWDQLGESYEAEAAAICKN